MSWLPNPFKSLRLSADEDSPSDAVSGGASGGGSVKEDLSEIGETIGRQLRGVAAFLAPPPPLSPPRAANEQSGDTRSPRLAGIRNDLAEISGSLRSSLSLVSSKKAVIGISKLASSFMRRNVEEGDDHGGEITGGVVDFVTEISDCPECWTDFPLSLADSDFAMTEAQSRHISIIEQVVPSIADLRIKLSTVSSDMSERPFWMIYFILLIPRLNESSLILLSTPEVVEARKTLLAMMRNKRNSLTPDSKRDHIVYSSQSDSTEGTSGKFSEEEGTDTASIDAQRQLQNEGDISFSDLEDDAADVSVRQYGPGREQDVGSCSSDGSSEWVRLNKNLESGKGRSRKGQLCSRNRDSEGEESNDWLMVHEFDYIN